MQAIMETLFDAVYLITVITIGIRMIRGSKGKDRKSTRLNSSHVKRSRMPSSA